MTTLNYYLLVFDHKNNVMLEQIEFGDNVTDAVATYNRKERKYSKAAGVNTLLVGSDSIETVKATHSTYFPDGSRRLVADALAEARQMRLAWENSRSSSLPSQA